MIGFSPSRMTNTYFPCILHTWLTARADSFWPSALAVLEEFIAADRDSDRQSQENSHIEVFRTFVFFMREQASELVQSTSIRNYHRMKDIILTLLQLSLRGHLMPMPAWEISFLCSKIMSPLSLLSCLPPDSDGPQVVLKAVWQWYERERRSSTFPRIQIHRLLQGELSVDENLIRFGMIFVRITGAFSDVWEVPVDSSGHLGTWHKDILSIMRPDHPNITWPYDYNAEKKTLQILKSYFQTNILPMRCRDLMSTAIVQSRKQTKPKPSTIYSHNA
jgi:hypothetical protein